MKSEHTPGPWTVEKHETRIRIRAIDSLSIEESVALVPKGKIANAHLIAACPDLFATALAFSKFLFIFENGSFAALMNEMQNEPGMFNLVRTVRDCRKAVNETIAKAKGGAQ